MPVKFSSSINVRAVPLPPTASNKRYASNKEDKKKHNHVSKDDILQSIFDEASAVVKFYTEIAQDTSIWKLTSEEAPANNDAVANASSKENKAVCTKKTSEEEKQVDDCVKQKQRRDNENFCRDGHSVIDSNNIKVKKEEEDKCSIVIDETKEKYSTTSNNIVIQAIVDEASNVAEFSSSVVEFYATLSADLAEQVEKSAVLTATQPTPTTLEQSNGRRKSKEESAARLIQMKWKEYKNAESSKSNKNTILIQNIIRQGRLARYNLKQKKAKYTSAAITIQREWKRYDANKKSTNAIATDAAITIQKQWRCYYHSRKYWLYVANALIIQISLRRLMSLKRINQKEIQQQVTD